jgi:hypothetical protein
VENTIVSGIKSCAGAFDASSTKGPILPHLRNIDGLNTHDDGFQLAIAGGVTSVQVLSGSVNNIGIEKHQYVLEIG